MVFLPLFSLAVELLMKVAILVSLESRFVETDIRSPSMLKKVVEGVRIRWCKSSSKK